MSEISSKTIDAYTFHAGLAGDLLTDIEETLNSWNELEDFQIDDINTYFETANFPTDFVGETEGNKSAINLAFNQVMVRVEEIAAWEPDTPQSPEYEYEQDIGTNKEVLEEAAGIQELVKNTGYATIGAFDPEDSRFGDLELDGQPLTKDDEQIVADVMYLIQNLPKEEQSLMAMELANAGFYDRVGGLDAVFVNFEEGKALDLDMKNFGMALGEALYYAEEWKPTGEIVTGEVEGQVIKAPGQTGLGISLAYDILSGQSGLTGEEIYSQFVEAKQVEAMERKNITYYDPLALAETVNAASRDLLGENVSNLQKEKFLKYMVDVVEKHSASNVQLTSSTPSLYAKSFLEEENPLKTEAAKKSRAVQALNRVVLGGR